MKKPHLVFLAEDDADDQELLIEMMKEQHNSIEFCIANTGSKAIEMLKNLPDDKFLSLIILDYNLPEMSGAELLARLQEMKRFNEVLKVVWSTSNSPVYEKKCMDLGAHSYMVKPTGITEVKAIARELVELCTKRH